MAHNINININFVQAEASINALIQASTALNEVITKLKTTISSYNGAVGNSSNANSKGKKSIADYTGSYKDLAATIAKTRKEYDRELQALAALRGQTDRNVASETAQVAKVKELEVALKLQISTLKQYNSALGISATKSNVASAATSKLGGSMSISKLGGSMSILGTLKSGFGSLAAVSGVSLGVYGAFRVIKDMTVTVTEFGLAQKKLQSILGETNKGMQIIRASAIEVGKASIFGAKGVTELQVELAKMGFTTDEIMAMQQAIVNLATATQEELSSASEVVANIIRAFQLHAAEATRVVDAMGKAFNDSALDLANFREAIKYVAPVAHEAGFSLEETIAVLEVLSQVGIKGSLAGTGFNNVLRAMMEKNSKLAKELGGTVKGFDGFISVLRKAKDEGWDTEKIFGVITQRATTSFTTLKEGVEVIKKYKEGLTTASDIMETQAGVQLDSVAYKTRRLKNNYEALILEMDDSSGVLSKTLGFFIDIGNAIINVFSDPTKSMAKLQEGLKDTMNTLTKLQSGNLDEPFAASTKGTKDYLNAVDELSVGLTTMTQSEKNLLDIALNQSSDYYKKKAEIMATYTADVKKLKTIEGLTFSTPANFLVGGPVLFIRNVDRATKDMEAALEQLKKDFPHNVEQLNVAVETALEKYGEPLVNQFLSLADEQGLEKANAAIKGRLMELITKYQGDALRLRILDAATKKIEEEYEKRKVPPEDINKAEIEAAKKAADAAKKAAQDKMRADVELMEFEKKQSAAKIELERQTQARLIEIQIQDDTTRLEATFDGGEQIALREKISKAEIQLAKLNSDAKRKIDDSDLFYANKIVDREYDYEKVYSDNKILAQKKYLAESKLLAINNKIAINEINNKQDDTLFSNREKLLREIDSINQAQLKQAYEFTSKRNDIYREAEEERIKQTLKGTSREKALQQNKYKWDAQALTDKFNYEIALQIDNWRRNEELYKIYLAEMALLKLKSESPLKDKYEAAPNPNNISLGDALKFQDIIKGDKIDEWATAADYAFEQVKSGINQIADAWVDATDRIVEARNRAVDEAEAALQTELQLAEAGFASNVTLKRKELAEAKRSRKEAMEEQKKAQKAQAKIDLAQTISSLAVAAANTFKYGTALGLWGIPIAMAMIAAMITAFSAFKQKIKAASAVVMGKGGWVHGKSHSQGGTLVEAEKDEFIVNKKSAVKYRTILESINRDEKITIDRVHMNRFKDGVLTAKVSLDDSKDLKAIRKILEQREKSIEFKDGYRIERYGSMLTKIKLN